LTDHDQAVNWIDNVINGMVSQGMRAEDIANHFYPENTQSMRADNIPKIIRDATVKAKRTARTEAAAREDAIIKQTFKINNVKYFDWVTEPGACQKCTFLALSGPYKVGDEDSPRVPESSHPNCRCKRIKAEILDNQFGSKLEMDLQYFAKPRNYDDVQKMIADGSISLEKFEERKKEFDKASSKGVKMILWL